MIIDITKDFAVYAETVWQAEMNLKPFHRAALTCWLPDTKAFRFFGLRECDKILLFDESFIVYIEKNGNEKRTVHFSRLKQFDPDKAQRELQNLRDTLFREGVKIIDGWILKKNKGLQRFALGIGFRRTPLEMMCGTYRGTPLEWQLFRITRV